MKYQDFPARFESLTGFAPFPWQESLYRRFMGDDELPTMCDLPTGVGKTSIIAIWLIALASHPESMPRRLVYVVNRRTVVDQTTDEVELLRRNLQGHSELKALRHSLGSLAVSTLRGQFADNEAWSADPSRPAVICGTVDMIGSRLLFSGFRIGFKKRPLHAGLLGQDVLLVHDESHLEPAFQKLIESIEEQQLNETDLGVNLPWPKLRVMALSATTRSDIDDNSASVAAPFRLTPEERNPPETIPSPTTEPIHSVWRRLKAAKKLRLDEIEDEKKLADEVAEPALEKYKDSGRAVIVFVRKVEDVEKIVKKLPKKSTKQLTGTLRGLERDELVKTPVFQRFLPESSRDKNIEAAEGTVYLVCTSAGEVGVNISADHLVCDLSTFESMAQRFGRVNRFGNRDDTEIHVVCPASFGKDGKTSDLDQCREKTLELLKKLNGDASPLALGKLPAKDRAAAFAPEPTILPASDILFDAWSLTTIREKMPGRPLVEPYLHGVSNWEPPQTQVAWREEVERVSNDLLERYKPQDLLDDYPLKAHELLRDRSDRVFKHVKAIGDSHPDASAWLVSDRGTVDVLPLRELVDKNNKYRINGTTVLLSPAVGGLREGLLDGKAESADDVANHWYEDVEQTMPRRVRLWDDDAPPNGMALVRTIDTKPDADELQLSQDVNGGSERRFWRWYVRPRHVEDATRASAKPITWEHHTNDVVQRTKAIVEALKWPNEWSELKRAIILAAKLHDLGKKRELWQRSIGNPRPSEWYAKPGKPTHGPRWRPRKLSDYRHEFGSLLDVLDDSQMHRAELEEMGEEMQDLVLHLIAAHHGRARPHFPTEEAFDPASGHVVLSAEETFETPRRFARLQRRYGRWGLAYLESLLRAADWAASAEPSKIEEDNS